MPQLQRYRSHLGAERCVALRFLTEQAKIQWREGLWPLLTVAVDVGVLRQQLSDRQFCYGRSFTSNPMQLLVRV